MITRQLVRERATDAICHETKRIKSSFLRRIVNIVSTTGARQKGRRWRRRRRRRRRRRQSYLSPFLWLRSVGCLVLTDVGVTRLASMGSSTDCPKFKFAENPFVRKIWKSEKQLFEYLVITLKFTKLSNLNILQIKMRSVDQLSHKNMKVFAKLCYLNWPHWTSFGL